MLPRSASLQPISPGVPLNSCVPSRSCLVQPRIFVCRTTRGVGRKVTNDQRADEDQEWVPCASVPRYRRDNSAGESGAHYEYASIGA